MKTEAYAISEPVSTACAIPATQRQPTSTPKVRSPLAAIDVSNSVSESVSGWIARADATVKTSVCVSSPPTTRERIDTHSCAHCSATIVTRPTSVKLVVKIDSYDVATLVPAKRRL